jgi:tyrosinase
MEETMPTRRHFVVGAVAALAAPYVARRSASAATPIVRRDVMDMADNDRFFSDYASAVKKMHSLTSDGRNWVSQAKIHADYCHHSGIEFLHWHRHYIRFFEKICAELCGNPNFALPYWNWSKKSGRIPAPFFDLSELNVEHWSDSGQYDGKAWGPINTLPRRGLDKSHGLLDSVRGGAFTLDTINGIKRLPNIDLFRTALEGQPHNTGHVVSGALPSNKVGHIGDGLSPLDPIFWLHHCMVDRVWAEWQKSGHATPDPKADYSNQFIDADGKPATANSTGAMDIAGLGYDYDIFQPGLTSAEATELSAQKIKEFKGLFPPKPPETIGSAANESASVANLETAIAVGVPTLKSRIAELRAAETVGLGLAGGRILAILSELKLPEANDLVVNVFVDCPYLSPETPYTDPHYAGTFSFFGNAMKMPGMEQPNYVIDVTKPVREAGFTPEKLKLQFMPITANAEGESKSTFRVGKVNILAI